MDQAASDKDLINLIKQGHTHALAQIYDRHSARLLAFVYNILKNKHEAEDLLHDLFLEVWNKAKDYDPTRGSVKCWLYVRARSRALDRYSALALLHNRHGFALPFDEQPSKDHCEHNLNTQALEKALSSLSPQQRMALMLSYFYGLTYAEIAQNQNIPIGTVKSRIASAVKNLSAQFHKKQEVLI